MRNLYRAGAAVCAADRIRDDDAVSAGYAADSAIAPVGRDMGLCSAPLLDVSCAPRVSRIEVIFLGSVPS